MISVKTILEAKRKNNQDLNYLTDPVNSENSNSSHGDDYIEPNIENHTNKKINTSPQKKQFYSADTNLLNGRKYQQQSDKEKNSIGVKVKKTFNDFKNKFNPKPVVGDMNLLDGRKYQQQSDMDKQMRNSRMQDRENYIKIKNLVKPHLKNIGRTLISRNYWQKDIKPGLETIANAFKR